MKRDQRIHKSIMSFLLLMVVIISFAPLTVMAAPINVPGISNLCEAIKKENKKSAGSVQDSNIHVVLKPGAPEGTKTEVFKCGADGLTFDKTAFDNGTEKSRKEAMQTLVDSLHKANMTEQNQQYVIDNLISQDSDVSRMMIPLVMDSTNADLYTAMKWLGPLLPIVRVLFGIGAVVISILLVGSTIIDLCFIGLPVMRESMNNRAEGKGSGNIPFVSSDAVSVINETEGSRDSSGGYKNAYLVYFKRRVITYIILSVCLLYLVLGELSGLISWLLSLGDGIVGGS